MGLVRSVLNIGAARAVTIPREWLRFYDLLGIRVRKFTVEATDTGLTLKPALSTKDLKKLQDYVEILESASSLATKEFKSNTQKELVKV